MINWNKINEKISVNKIILPLFMVILILLSILYAFAMKRVLKKNMLQVHDASLSLNYNSRAKIQKKSLTDKFFEVKFVKYARLQIKELHFLQSWIFE